VAADDAVVFARLRQVAWRLVLTSQRIANEASTLSNREAVR
jgi:hypothetical protein